MHDLQLKDTNGVVNRFSKKVGGEHIFSKRDVNVWRGNEGHRRNDSRQGYIRLYPFKLYPSVSSHLNIRLYENFYAFDQESSLRKADLRQFMIESPRVKK
jgi:hypothetical protein